MQRKKMNKMKRAVAVVLTCGMMLTNNGAAAEKAPETEAPVTEAQTEAKDTEVPVTEVQTEAVTETTATEAITETETVTETVTETADSEVRTEIVTEEESTEAETETESESENETEAETESESETESETESESETEAEVVLDTVITQEVFQQTLEDQSVQPMIKYTVRVVNKTKEAAAENITVKAVMADHLVTVNQEGTTPDMVHYNTLEEALNANAFEAKELDEADKGSYVGNEAVMWKNQNIAEGSEKSFVFFASVQDEIVNPEELRNVWIINGEKVTDTNKIRWIGTELLKVKKDLPTEFTFENEIMIVTATLSDANILPEGVTFVVEEKELTKEARALLEESLESDQTVAGYTVYDMHFELDGQEIEPEGGNVSVSVRYKESLKLVEQDAKKKSGSKDAEAEEYKVFHVSDTNGEKTIEDVTNHVEGTDDGLVSEVGFTTESFSDLIIAALTPLYSLSTDPENRTFSSYLPYRIESFLQGYNVLSFGDVDMTLHCMGAVLVGGNFNNTSSGYADGENLPPSYVKGKINGNAVYNSRNKTNNKPLYAGSSNTVELQDEGSNKAYFVNGIRTGNAVNGTAPAYQSDNFFDFAAARSIVDNASAALRVNAGSATVEGDVVTVISGTKVALSGLSGINRINIEGNMTDPVNTVVNIPDGGSVSLPQMNINGSQPGVQEQGSGTSIVWNLPNATRVEVPSQNWVGHIIAPKAHVVMNSGNYNGSVICQSMYSNAEGHIYPYNGGTLIPTSGDFVARKTVNGEVPAATEIFRFTMTQIDGKDTFSKTVENTGETVDFGTISYSEAGTYYYIIEENAENPLAGYTYDTTQYLVEVIVGSTQSGLDAVLSKDIYYYLIVNADDEAAELMQINGADYYISTAVEKVVFDNLKENKGSLKVTKTTTGGTTPDEAVFTVINADGIIVAEKKYNEFKADGYFTVENLPVGTYTVTESGADVKGYTLVVTGNGGTAAVEEDKISELTVTNKYIRKKAAEIVLRASKNLTGRTLEADQFTFRITETDENGAAIADGYTASAKNDAPGTVLFPGIQYDEPGTHYYQITEVNDVKSGYEYDNSVYNVAVKVSDGEDSLSAEITEVKKNGEVLTGAPEIVFTNTYSASGEFTLKALKSMKSADTKLGTFRFELKDENGNLVETVSNDANGVVTFSRFIYTLEDAGRTFTYTVNEKQPSQTDRYIYDNTVYKVTIAVTDNGDGTLKTEAKVGEDVYTDQTIKFVNDVTSMNVQKTDIADGKKLKGAELQVLDQAGKVMERWTSAVEAHEVKGLTPGAVYTLREVTAPFGYDKITSDIQFTMDTNGVVTVVSAGKNAEGKSEASADGTVLIVKDTITEELVVSYTAEAMTVTGERDSYDNIINANFKNTYEKPDLPSGNTHTQKNTQQKQSAKTGDDTNIMMYILLAVFAVAAGGTAIYLKRRRRTDK